MQKSQGACKVGLGSGRAVPSRDKRRPRLREGGVRSGSKTAEEKSCRIEPVCPHCMAPLPRFSTVAVPVMGSRKTARKRGQGGCVCMGARLILQPRPFGSGLGGISNVTSLARLRLTQPSSSSWRCHFLALTVKFEKMRIIRRLPPSARLWLRKQRSEKSQNHRKTPGEEISRSRRRRF
jgi:hypothetical protein